MASRAIAVGRARGQKATVEGTVVAVFTSNKENTFINFGGKYPHQTFTGYIPADSALEGISRSEIASRWQTELSCCRFFTQQLSGGEVGRPDSDSRYARKSAGVTWFGQLKIDGLTGQGCWLPVFNR